MTGSWVETYDSAVARFGGQTQSVALEAELVEAFTQRPEAVQRIVVKVGDGFESGRIHSPWAVVRTELGREQARALVVVAGSPERERAIHLAERRIANLGHVLPSEAELIEELFGKRALLEPWAHDEALRARMVDAWRRQARAPIAWPRR